MKTRLVLYLQISKLETGISSCSVCFTFDESEEMRRTSLLK